MDNSDGIAGTIHAMCRASGLGAIVVKERFPIRPETADVAVQLGIDPFQFCLASGDWQHVWAMDEGAWEHFSSLLEEDCGDEMKITVIGRFTEEPGVRIRAGGRTYAFPCIENDRFGTGGTSFFEALTQPFNFLGKEIQE